MCQNTTMRVNGAWMKRNCVLCSKIYNTLHSCHNFPAGSLQAARGVRICETRYKIIRYIDFDSLYFAALRQHHTCSQTGFGTICSTHFRLRVCHFSNGVKHYCFMIKYIPYLAAIHNQNIKHSNETELRLYRSCNITANSHKTPKNKNKSGDWASTRKFCIAAIIVVCI